MSVVPTPPPDRKSSEEWALPECRVLQFQSERSQAHFITARRYDNVLKQSRGRQAAFLKDKQNHNENDRLAHHLQHLHDIRMVRPLEIQGITALDRHPGKLDDRVCRVLLSGARESNRLVSILSSAAEDYSRSHHACRVLRFFRNVLA